MKTFRGPDNNINNWTNSTGSDIASDQVVVLKSGAAGEIGVADGAIPNGSTGTLWTHGRFEITALSTDTGAVGDPWYWDGTNSRLTSTSTSNTYAGRLRKPKLNGDTTAVISINVRSAT